MAVQACCRTCCSSGAAPPNKILYSQASGQIWQTDLVPLYDGHGLLERNEPVPFRRGPRPAALFAGLWSVNQSVRLIGAAMVAVAAAAAAECALRWHPSFAAPFGEMKISAVGGDGAAMHALPCRDMQGDAMGWRSAGSRCHGTCVLKNDVCGQRLACCGWWPCKLC